jgi:hypothetical protein
MKLLQAPRLSHFGTLLLGEIQGQVPKILCLQRFHLSLHNLVSCAFLFKDTSLILLIHYHWSYGPQHFNLCPNTACYMTVFSIRHITAILCGRTPYSTSALYLGPCLGEKCSDKPQKCEKRTEKKDTCLHQAQLLVEMESCKLSAWADLKSQSFPSQPPKWLGL